MLDKVREEKDSLEKKGNSPRYRNAIVFVALIVCRGSLYFVGYVIEFVNNRYKMSV